MNKFSEALKELNTLFLECGCNYSDILEGAVQEIERLQTKCDAQSRIIKQLVPEHYSTPFIHALVGEKDSNGLTDIIFVVPTYGCDFHYTYKREK
jgi:hypothetical protein